MQQAYDELRAHDPREATNAVLSLRHGPGETSSSKARKLADFQRMVVTRARVKELERKSGYFEYNWTEFKYHWSQRGKSEANILRRWEEALRSPSRPRVQLIFFRVHARAVLVIITFLISKPPHPPHPHPTPPAHPPYSSPMFCCTVFHNWEHRCRERAAPSCSLSDAMERTARLSMFRCAASRRLGLSLLRRSACFCVSMILVECIAVCDNVK